MTKGRIAVFEMAHLIDIKIRHEERVHIFSAPGVYERTYLIMDQSIAAGTMFYGDTILACFGIHCTFPGSYEAWILPSQYVAIAPIFFVKTIKQYLDSFAKTFQCHRIQTTSIDDPFHERWMSAIGFQKEGTLRQFTHTKKNFCIYGRLWQ